MLIIFRTFMKIYNPYVTNNVNLNLNKIYINIHIICIALTLLYI